MLSSQPIIYQKFPNIYWKFYKMIKNSNSYHEKFVKIIDNTEQIHEFIQFHAKKEKKLDKSINEIDIFGLCTFFKINPLIFIGNKNFIKFSVMND